MQVNFLFYKTKERYRTNNIEIVSENTENYNVELWIPGNPLQLIQT